MLNKVILIGRLGADPEVRFMPNGGQVTTIRLATNRRWKDKQSGEKRDETEWHRVVFFTRLAEIASEYLKKGSQIYVEGRIRTQKWQGQDGQDRFTTEIVAEEMHMLDNRSGGTASFGNEPQTGHAQPRPSQQNNTGPMSSPPSDYDDFDDDIPF